MFTDSSQVLPFSVCPSVKRSFGAQEGRGGGGGECSSWVAGGESGGAIYEWTDGAVIIILHWMERLLPSPDYLLPCPSILLIVLFLDS